jgi:hypothetical protein
MNSSCSFLQPLISSLLGPHTAHSILFPYSGTKFEARAKLQENLYFEAAGEKTKGSEVDGNKHYPDLVCS